MLEKIVKVLDSECDPESGKQEGDTGSHATSAKTLRGAALAVGGSKRLKKKKEEQLPSYARPIERRTRSIDPSSEKALRPARSACSMCMMA